MSFGARAKKGEGTDPTHEGTAALRILSAPQGASSSWGLGVTQTFRSQQVLRLTGSQLEGADAEPVQTPVAVGPGARPCVRGPAEENEAPAQAGA